jgi:hypothetical protein
MCAVLILRRILNIVPNVWKQSSYSADMNSNNTVAYGSIGIKVHERELLYVTNFLTNNTEYMEYDIGVEVV